MTDFSFKKYKGYRNPQYKGMTVEARYVTMRDGVRIALDLHLPENLPADAKIPTIFVQTRYWRAREYRAGFGWLERLSDALPRFFVSHGYALLTVDVRGTGASFGTRQHPWDAEEILDFNDLVDWVIAQPWSNGKVGGYGTSYSGTTAELLTAVQHPAVKAVIPRFNEFDVYTDISFPGGIYVNAFVDQWGETNRDLDANRVPSAAGLLKMLIKGVKPVDEDKDRTLSKEAVFEHRKNISADAIARGITYRDQPSNENGVLFDQFSVHAYREKIEGSQAALYSWGGWMDAGTADGIIRRFMTFSNPQLGIIGAWNHGASQHASPYAPAKANLSEHWIEYLRFFDYHLKGIETGVMENPLLAYFTMGEEKWKTTPTWPPAGSKTQRWYLAEGNTLSLRAPKAAAGEDEYTVDFEATTGTTNRWHTQAGGGMVEYPDRAAQDRRLLTYTSPPLAEETEITGYPIVSLHLKSTATDGAFLVYLEDIDEKGRVIYLTEGHLRALHRKISTDAPPYTQFTPYHSFKSKDGLPLVPGEITELRFGLLPISVLIKKGHRIRIAIAGADKDSLLPIAEEQNPVIHVARNHMYRSYIDLPIISREK
jgi:putative CocE/NonD family hydrolase